MITISQAITFFRSSQAFRQSVIMTVGTVITGCISALSMILLSRFLGPVNFGIFSVGITIMAIISKIGDLGLNSLITRWVGHWPKKDTKSLLQQIYLWKIYLMVSGFAIFTVLVPTIGQLLNFPYPHLLYLAVLGSAVLILYEHVYLVLSAKHDFFEVSLLSVLQAVAKLLSFAALLLLTFLNVVVVSWLYYLAPLFAIALIVLFRPDSFVFPPKQAPLKMRSKMLQFSFHAGLGVVAMTLISNLDLLLIQKYLSPFETGLYAGAGRVAIFVGFVTASIGSVLNNRVTRYQDVSTLKLYLRKSLTIIVVSFLGFLLFLPFARIAVILTIGSEYLSGLPSLVLLVFNAFLSLAIVPFTSFFYAVDKPRYFSVGGFLQAMTIFIGSVIFLPRYGIVAAALSKVAATIIFSLYTYWSIRKVLSETKERAAGEYVKR